MTIRHEARRGHKHLASDLLSDSLTAGDILYVDSGGELTTLPIGSNSEVLTIASGLPSWAAAASGPTGTVTGSIQIWNGSAWVEETSIIVSSGQIDITVATNTSALEIDGSIGSTTIPYIDIYNMGVNVDRTIMRIDESVQGGGEIRLVADFSGSGDNNALNWQSDSGSRAILHSMFLSGDHRFSDQRWIMDYDVGFISNTPIYIVEQANANADTAGRGQFWIKSDVPNNPMFTNDVGSDFNIAKSGGTTGGTGSAGAGNQYIEISIAGTTYKVLHDGTV